MRTSIIYQDDSSSVDLLKSGKTSESKRERRKKIERKKQQHLHIDARSRLIQHLVLLLHGKQNVKIKWRKKMMMMKKIYCFGRTPFTCKLVPPPPPLLQQWQNDVLAPNHSIQSGVNQLFLINSDIINLPAHAYKYNFSFAQNENQCAIRRCRGSKQSKKVK